MRLLLASVIGVSVLASMAHAQKTPQPHNLVIFVPDGLRAVMVDKETAPAMAEAKEKGVWFANTHSLFPTFTMANASGLSTGHSLGDTGVFSNTIFAGYHVAAAKNSVTPFIENDAVLGELDQHFSADFLDEETILRAADAAGFSTAAIGKVGPTLLFDHTDRTGSPTMVVDDATGSPAGIPIGDELKKALQDSGLPLAAPSRGANGSAGTFEKPGTTVANVEQQAFFANVATKAVLPIFKARKKPFVLVFWSRDPDGSQHNQGDSLNELKPGINGPTSLAAIRNADNNLAQIREALQTLGLAATTNVLIAADHGFSTISKQSATSPSTLGVYAGVPKGSLPGGFLAIDIAHALGLPLHDPEKETTVIGPGERPASNNGVIGKDTSKPDVVVAANGGSDLIYLPNRDKALARRIVSFLSLQDYTSGMFVDDALGPIPGTLPLSAINLLGHAKTPRPSIVINFRSFDTGCGTPVKCAVEVADTALQQGQGMHGSFSRADTQNVMIAIGPAFKTGFVDPAPASNADIGRTAMALLGLRVNGHGTLIGRVLSEAMPNRNVPKFETTVLRSPPDANGQRTVLRYQLLGTARYFDAAGYPGRTVGLE